MIHAIIEAWNLRNCEMYVNGCMHICVKCMEFLSLIAGMAKICLRLANKIRLFFFFSKNLIGVGLELNPITNEQHRCRFVTGSHHR